MGLTLDADNVVVTSGATEALAASLLALVEPGDEVIIFTPAYDAYAPLVRRAGGVVREVALQPPGWRIERAAIEAAVGPKTRAIVFNNPHNPTGRLFDADELEAVAAVARDHDLIVISDEVWEHILLDGQTFAPIAALPGMAERTIKIGSAGKIFSLTGWKVGWLVAPPEMAQRRRARASIPDLRDAAQFAGGGGVWIERRRRMDRADAGAVRARAGPDDRRVAARRAMRCSTAHRPISCASTSPRRALARTTRRSPSRRSSRQGWRSCHCRHSPKQDPPRHLIRLCFAKRDETIDAGVAALKRAMEIDAMSEARALLDELGVGGSVGDLVSHSPIDGSEIGRVRIANAADVAAVCGRSAEAFLAWRNVPAPRRGELVRLLGEELRAAKEPLARLVTLEAGKIVQEGLGEVQEMIDICDYAVGLSRQLYGLTIASERPDHRMIEQWHPLGPVAVISAFNFPVAVWAWNAALALVCGDPVIWKPSEKTPLTAEAVMAVMERALERFGDAPDGLVQLVQGGRDAGEALVEDPRVALVSATGSTAMGRQVGPKVAERFGRSLLELGGNNAMIVTPSADLKLAERAILFSAAGTAGQRCTSLRRLIVHRGHCRRPGRAGGDTCSARRAIGDPREPDTLVGPLIDRCGFRRDAGGADQGARARWRRPWRRGGRGGRRRHLRPAGAGRAGRAGRRGR